MQKSILAATEHLKQVDTTLKNLIDKHGPCTLFDDNSLLHQSHFHVLVWAIINQQLSVKSAQAIENKLLAKLDDNTFNLSSIAALDDKQLAACGLSRQKIRYLRALSEAVQSKQLVLDNLKDKTNEAISEILIELPGIGPWTVDMFLIFSLGRLDVLPLGDLALRKSLALHYQLKDDAKLHEYQTIARKWDPYQTIASWYLWLAVD